jgi:hypothetical protein
MFFATLHVLGAHKRSCSTTGWLVSSQPGHGEMRRVSNDFGHGPASELLVPLGR